MSDICADLAPLCSYGQPEVESDDDDSNECDCQTKKDGAKIDHQSYRRRLSRAVGLTNKKSTEHKDSTNSNEEAIANLLGDDKDTIGDGDNNSTHHNNGSVPSVTDNSDDDDESNVSDESDDDDGGCNRHKHRRNRGCNRGQSDEDSSDDSDSSDKKSSKCGRKSKNGMIK
jgi:hypothetical protein